MENLLFRSVYFLVLIFIFRKPHYKWFSEWSWTK
jgi:hypothetical protein